MSPERGLTWEQAVPEALCFGWIDRVAQGIDADARAATVDTAQDAQHLDRGEHRARRAAHRRGQDAPAGLAAYERRQAERSGMYSYEAGRELAARRRARLLRRPGRSGLLGVRHADRTAGSPELGALGEAGGDPVSAGWLQLIEDSAHGRLIPSQRYGTQPEWVERAGAAADAVGHQGN